MLLVQTTAYQPVKDPVTSRETSYKSLTLQRKRSLHRIKIISAFNGGIVHKGMFKTCANDAHVIIVDNIFSLPMATGSNITDRLTYYRQTDY